MCLKSDTDSIDHKIPFLTLVAILLQVVMPYVAQTMVPLRYKQFYSALNIQ